MEKPQMNVNDAFEVVWKWRAEHRLKDDGWRKEGRQLIKELGLNPEQAFLVGSIDELFYDMALEVGFTKEVSGHKNFLNREVRKELVRRIWGEFAK